VPGTKVNEQYELEKTIISLLLLYGSIEEEFEELVVKIDDKGEMKLEPEINRAKVYEKIYLDLQEDEMKFANPNFKEVYDRIIRKFTAEGELVQESFLNEIPVETAAAITDILMEDDRYALSNWEGKEIFVRSKEDRVGQMVQETILNLRRFLVKEKVKDLSKKLPDSSSEESQEILQEIMDYDQLRKKISEKLMR
ncbi:hypothetical protein, partial [Longispora fulva]